MSYRLLVRPLHGKPYGFPLDKDFVTIGRSARNDLVLDDHWLSRFHTEIRFGNDTYFIHDLDSRNGTAVNGVRLRGKVALHKGDVVALGDHTLTFGEDTLSGRVVLVESGVEEEVEDTVALPTEQLLASTRPRTGDTWESVKGLSLPSLETPADGTALLLKQIQILGALREASAALISHRSEHELLEFILELVFQLVRAERGFLMLIPRDGEGLEVKAVRTSSGTTRSDENFSFSRSIAEKVIREKVSVLTRNAMTDPRFRSQDSVLSLGIRSAMCVPLYNNETVTGLIYVDSQLSESVFTEEDLSLLTALANLAAMKLENTRLLEQMVEKKRIDHELAMAHEIQSSLLPDKAPHVAGWDIAGSNNPCYTIGGDYFDFVERPDGRFAFALGDVSGKGAGGALIMMVLRATIHSLAPQEGDLRSILSKTNSVVYHNSPAQSYVTFFMGDLEPGSGELKYVNAGHVSPILYRRESGKLERLEAGSTVVGLFEDTDFQEGTTSMGPGDLLLVFSDGISDAWGEDGVEFGEVRLEELVRGNAELSAHELLRKAEVVVDQYTKDSRPNDDRTLIVVKRAKP